MGKLNIYQRYFIVVALVIIVAYLFVFLLLPVTIDNASVPTLVNGITTSMSIIIGFGGAMTGIVFRDDINKGGSEAKKTYLGVLGLFIIPLIYPWGAYLALATKQFEFAVKYSFGGYLVALLAIIMVYILIAKRWDLEKEGKPEPEKKGIGKNLNLKRTDEGTEGIIAVSNKEETREQIRGLYIVGLLATLVAVKIGVGTIANSTVDFLIFGLILWLSTYSFCMLFTYTGIPQPMRTALKELSWISLLFIACFSIGLFCYISYLTWLANSLIIVLYVVFAVLVAMLYYFKKWLKTMWKKYREKSSIRR